MASHFISYDYLARNKKTMDKVSISTPDAFTVPSRRAGKAYEKGQEVSFQGKVALHHAFIAIEKLEGKRVRKPYLQPSERRDLKFLAKLETVNAS